MLLEQNAVLGAFSERIFRFMPLAVFLDEDFESAQRIFSSDSVGPCTGNRKRSPIIVLPPVVSHNAVVHPVKSDFKISPVVPRFIASPSCVIPREFSGIVTAFAFGEISPNEGRPDGFSEIGCGEHAVTVFRLCRIDFCCENRAWKWRTAREKWIKL
jgi:hypothetical protein